MTDAAGHEHGSHEGHEGYDALVVGGGAAGLSAGLTLARARRTVLVVDEGRPRNAPAHGVHGYLTRDGVAPSELAALGRAEVEAYGGRVVPGRVERAERDGDGFRVHLGEGVTLRARRLLVATGLVDRLPAVPGVAERWGRDVVHCPYCHGWEVRDRRLAVLATGPLAVHQALLFRQWSGDVTLLRHVAPAPAADQLEQLDARGITVVEGEVSALEVHKDRLTGARLADGRVVACDALVVAAPAEARSGVLESLGARPSEFRMGEHVVGTHVPSDPTGLSPAPGVWVAGNVTDIAAQVVHAAGAGVRAAAALNADLVAEDTRRAVELRRTSSLRRDTDPSGDGGVDIAAQITVGGAEGAGVEGGEGGAGGALTEAERAWEERYSGDPVWSGRPNAVLVEVAGGLPAGTALDLGAGEGGDTVWLAGRGWHVTAVDIARNALRRVEAAAAAAGVGDHVRLERHDLAATFPQGVFDLVSAQFLHSMVEFPRLGVLRRAASAVAPGGLLLVVGHGGFPPWGRHAHGDGHGDGHGDAPGHDVHFETPDEVLAALDLAEGEWEVERADSPEREATGPGGERAVLVDHVLAVRRAPADRP